MSIEDTIKEWTGDGEIVALHEFKRLGATIAVVANDVGFYDMIRVFTLGDRIEVSMDVQSGSARDVFVRLMEILD
jgi:hypothetical protein